MASQSIANSQQDAKAKETSGKEPDPDCTYYGTYPYLHPIPRSSDAGSGPTAGAVVNSQPGYVRPTDLGKPVVLPLGTQWKTWCTRAAISNVWEMHDMGMKDLTIEMDGLEQAREEDEALPELSIGHLCLCHSLRMLTITGMEVFYQTVIWKCVWQNPCLEYLELGFEAIDQPGSPIFWELPDQIESSYGPTMPRVVSFPDITYPKREDIDLDAIEEARQLAGIGVDSERKLSIKVLALRGFNVANDTICKWFDPERLQEVILLGNYRATGLDLDGTPFAHVRVTKPPLSPSLKGGVRKTLPEMSPRSQELHKPVVPMLDEQGRFNGLPDPRRNLPLADPFWP